MNSCKKENISQKSFDKKSNSKSLISKKHLLKNIKDLL